MAGVHIPVPGAAPAVRVSGGGHKTEAFPFSVSELADAAGNILPLDTSGIFPIREVAEEVGFDRSVVRKRAMKLGCHLEKRYIVDTTGKRQAMVVTDEAGRDMLRRWFAR